MEVAIIKPSICNKRIVALERTRGARLAVVRCPGGSQSAVAIPSANQNGLWSGRNQSRAWAVRRESGALRQGAVAYVDLWRQQTLQAAIDLITSWLLPRAV
jgi:hypothetical protein